MHRSKSCVIALCLAAHASAQVTDTGWEQTLLNPVQNVNQSSAYGRHVALHGNFAAVATHRATANPQRGAVYMYQRADRDAPWLALGPLPNPNPVDPVPMGTAVAIAGDFVFASTATDGSGSPHAARGTVDVFEFTAQGSFAHRQTIDPQGIQPGDQFGHRLAAAGDLLVVGAPRTTSSGAVWVFRRGANGYAFEQVLSQQGGVAGDLFGNRVDTDGETLIVGDGTAQGSSNRGRVWMFEHSNGAWLERRVFTGQFGEHLGVAVAVDGDLAAAADAPTSGGPTRVRTYRRVGGSWQASVALSVPAGAGLPVAATISGSTLAVGWRGSSGIGSSHVRTWRATAAGNWSGARVLLPPSATLAHREYGTSLASDGSTLLIGSSNATDNPPFLGPGAATFRSIARGVVGDVDCLESAGNSRGAGASCLAFGSRRIADGNLEIHAGLLPQHTFGFFVVARNAGLVPLGSGQGTLCLSGGIGRYVNAISNSGSQGVISMPLDLNQIPQPQGFAPLVPGDTWRFQCWFRDSNPGLTSNLTGAVVVTFE